MRADTRTARRRHDGGPKTVARQTDDHRATEFDALYELHADAVYRSAVFVGDARAAERVTIQVFVEVWGGDSILDHTDRGWRGRLVASSVTLAAGHRTGWPEDDDDTAARGVLGFIRFSGSDYHEAAVALHMSETHVLRCLRAAVEHARSERRPPE